MSAQMQQLAHSVLSVFGIVLKDVYQFNAIPQPIITDPPVYLVLQVALIAA